MTLPDSVRDFIRDIFRDCNLKVSNKLSKHPGTWEPSLDLSLIEHLSNYSAPIQIEKSWTIRFDTHYLGGGRHWLNWEIADIGVLIIFRNNGKVTRSKIALFQSKRLYAGEDAGREDTIEDYIIGFRRLYEDDEIFKQIIKPRTMYFKEGSKYGALRVKDEQWEAIQEFQKKTTIPVHYLFYNPCRLPHSEAMPLTADIEYTSFSVGARVVPGDVLFKLFQKKIKDTILVLQS